MMKRLIVMTVVMLVVLATAASATLDTAWQVKIWATDLTGSAASTANVYGTGATGTNSTTYKDGNMNVYVQGTKASPRFRWIKAAPAASTVVEWALTIDAGSTYVATKMKLQLWNETGAANDLDPDLIGSDAFFVTLYKGSDIVYRFDPTKNGTSLAPTFTKEYDWSASQTSNDFVLKRELIPEPGSILALASGLVGLAGFAFRRKR